jgi:predicted N-acetyltransferase YhbS
MVKTHFRKYNQEQDFLRIRDFLVKTHLAFPQPLNWRIERWNYSRYFVAPMLGGWVSPDAPVESGLEAIRVWEVAIGVWENDTGEIVGVANLEHPSLQHPGYGEAFFQRHPQYGFLLPEMLDYAETHLRNPRTNTLFFYVYDYDEKLKALAQQRGYEKDEQDAEYDSVFTIERPLPERSLPDGYRIKSMANESDIERRREIFGRSFNHEDPNEWPSAFSYRELQRAPDYKKDLDLYVVAPDGRYAACCIVWYDAHNEMGILEPVGTHPDFRRLGLGKEIVLEGIRRAAALGAKRVWVGSGQQFYEAIGFKKALFARRWTKTL